MMVVVVLRMGMASGHLVAGQEELKSPLSLGNGPNKSTHTLSEGTVTTSCSCMGWAFSFLFACLWHMSHDLQCWATSLVREGQ